MIWKFKPLDVIKNNSYIDDKGCIWKDYTQYKDRMKASDHDHSDKSRRWAVVEMDDLDDIDISLPCSNEGKFQSEKFTNYSDWEVEIILGWAVDFLTKETHPEYFL